MNNEAIKEAKERIEWAIFRLSQDKDLIFIGGVLQSMSIHMTMSVPTAGVCFNEKIKQFQLYVNPEFFSKLTRLESKAVLVHEIYHIFHKHVYFDHTKYKKMMLNVAMDLVINQLIKDLPKEAMFIENFRDKNKNPFPKNQPTEVYYDLLLDDAEMKNPNAGESSQGQSDPNQKGQGQEWVKVQDHFKDMKEAFDSHDWGDTNDEAQMKEKLEALRDLAKRSGEKLGHSRIPGNIQDLLEEISKTLAKLDYKAILLSTLKKSMPAKVIQKTWKRPSRRYGTLAPGNKMGSLPKVYFLADTSGSIGYEEINDFLKVTEGFLTNGVEKAEIGLFNTATYLEKKVKKGFRLTENEVQSGGTDLTDSLTKVLKKSADLLIIMTDGYFDKPEVDLKKLPNTVMVFTKNHNENCPLINQKNVKWVKYVA